MGIRRDLADQYHFDASLVYGAEGDDLARRLTLDGHRIVHVELAISHHDHPMNLSHCMRRGYLQGIGCTRFWYKHNIYVGRDLLPLAAALITLPLGLLDVRLLALPACFVLIQLAALAYNEVVLKRKSLWQAILVYPVCLLFYAMRASAVPVTWFRLILGKEKPIQISKQRWQHSRRAK